MGKKDGFRLGLRWGKVGSGAVMLLIGEGFSAFYGFAGVVNLWRPGWRWSACLPCYPDDR